MAKGRPPKVKINDIIAAVGPYLEDADPPIVAEFAHQQGITRQYLYELAATAKKRGDARLSDAIKMLSEAKEIKLERGGLSGRYSPSVAIFSLKQLGWSDKGPADDAAEVEREVDPLTAAITAEIERRTKGGGDEGTE